MEHKVKAIIKKEERLCETVCALFKIDFERQKKAAYFVNLHEVLENVPSLFR